MKAAFADHRLLILLVCALLPIYVAVSQESNELLWPVKADPALTSSFCEFRPGHFHGGIDIKTYGQVGVPCLAVDDGTVVRMKVSGSGYGRALYLELNDGRVAVYAHLAGFNETLTDILHREQDRTLKYDHDLYFDKADGLRFKRGETIGFAGRSGTVHPHLHFELRDGMEVMLNPLLNGLRVSDTITPTPEGIAVTPLDAESTVEGDFQPRLYRRLIKQHDGVWRVGEPIGVSGSIGLAVDAYDRADGANNLMAAYRVTLQVNREQRWQTSFDRVGYDETRQIELERDYRLLRKRLGAYHRLYRTAGQRLHGLLQGDGILKLNEADDFPAEIRLTLSDVSGNQSVIELSFVDDRADPGDRVVMGEPLYPMEPMSANGGKISLQFMDGYIRLAAPPGVEAIQINGPEGYFLSTKRVEGGVAASWLAPPSFIGSIPFKAINHSGVEVSSAAWVLHAVKAGQMSEVISEDGQFKAMIHPQSLYDDKRLRIARDKSYEVAGWIESVYRVDPREIPLAKAVTVNIAGSGRAPEQKWGVYYYDVKRGWTFLGNTEQNGWLSGDALSWERFGLIRDEDAPRIKLLSPANGAILNNRRPLIEASISDSTSGVTASGAVLRLDGGVVPAEWDAPMRILRYKPWRDLADGEHQMEVIAVDRVGNKTTRKSTFTIQSGKR